MPSTAENLRDTKGGRARTAAKTPFNTDNILDLVERLGIVDMVTSRIRERIEEVDIDDVLDELGRYVRRNPEVLVVALATITVSAGLIVYLNSKNDFEYDEEEEAPVRVRSASKSRR